MAGVTLQPLDGSGLLAVKVDNNGSGDIAAPGAQGAGQIIRVYKLFIVCTGATSITFKNGSTALSGAMALAANGAITLDLDGQPWFVCSPNAAFNINSSGSTQVSGAVYYTVNQF